MWEASGQRATKGASTCEVGPVCAQPMCLQMPTCFPQRGHTASGRVWQGCGAMRVSARAQCVCFGIAVATSGPLLATNEQVACLAFGRLGYLGARTTNDQIIGLHHSGATGATSGLTLPIIRLHGVGSAGATSKPPLLISKSLGSTAMWLLVLHRACHGQPEPSVRKTQLNTPPSRNPIGQGPV